MADAEEHLLWLADPSLYSQYVRELKDAKDVQQLVRDFKVAATWPTDTNKAQGIAFMRADVLLSLIAAETFMGFEGQREGSHVLTAAAMLLTAGQRLQWDYPAWGGLTRSLRDVITGATYKNVQKGRNKARKAASNAEDMPSRKTAQQEFFRLQPRLPDGLLESMRSNLIRHVPVLLQRASADGRQPTRELLGMLLSADVVAAGEAAEASAASSSMSIESVLDAVVDAPDQETASNSADAASAADTAAAVSAAGIKLAALTLAPSKSAAAAGPSTGTSPAAAAAGPSTAAAEQQRQPQPVISTLLQQPAIEPSSVGQALSADAHVPQLQPKQQHAQEHRSSADTSMTAAETVVPAAGSTDVQRASSSTAAAEATAAAARQPSAEDVKYQKLLSRLDLVEQNDQHSIVSATITSDAHLEDIFSDAKNFAAALPKAQGASMPPLVLELLDKRSDMMQSALKQLLKLAKNGAKVLWKADERVVLNAVMHILAPGLRQYKQGDWQRQTEVLGYGQGGGVAKLTRMEGGKLQQVAAKRFLVSVKEAKGKVQVPAKASLPEHIGEPLVDLRLAACEVISQLTASVSTGGAMLGAVGMMMETEAPHDGRGKKLELMYLTLLMPVGGPNLFDAKMEIMAAPEFEQLTPEQQHTVLEYLTWCVLAELADKMAVFHDRCLSHGDIKAQNVLRQGPKPAGAGLLLQLQLWRTYTLCLIDAGHLQTARKQEMEESFVDLISSVWPDTGTDLLRAPEMATAVTRGTVVKNVPTKQRQAADIYSVGLIAAVMRYHGKPVSGVPLADTSNILGGLQWDGEEEQHVINRREEIIERLLQEWQEPSAEQSSGRQLIEIIRLLTDNNPDTRMTAAGLQQWKNGMVQSMVQTLGKKVEDIWMVRVE